MSRNVDVPLSQLVLSKHNIRKTGGKSVDDLAASIAADGLLQNLTVSRIPPNDGEPVDHFEVIAGGRRLAALKLLRDRGSLPPDFLVPCNIVAAGSATAVGIAENTVRQGMHPHDEYVAFRDLAAEGVGVETIAQRFGTTPLVVQRRLKLANVAPEILRAFRDDKLSLEAMMAFALTDDWSVQLSYFSAATRRWDLEAHAVRIAMTKREIGSEDGRVKFVGLDAYEQAGGAVRRDLFDNNGGGYVADETLLNQLVTEKLHRIRDELVAEGWLFVHTAQDDNDFYRFQSKHSRFEPKRIDRVLSDDETAELQQLRNRLEELDALLDNDSDDDGDVDFDQLDNERGAARVRIAELTRREEVWSDRQKLKSGALLKMGYHGTTEIVRGLIPPAAGAGDSSDGAGPAKAKPATLSEGFQRRLQAHRTIGLQCSLMKRGDIALAALTHALLGPLVYGSTRYDTALSVSATSERAPLQKSGFVDVDESQESALLDDAIAELRNTLGMPTRPAELWPWLLLQPASVLGSLLSLVAVMSCKSSSSADLLAQALGLDMADFWRPTASTFASLVPKAIALEAVREVHGKQAADGIAHLKKDEFAGKFEEAMAQTRWLPKPLRRTGYAPLKPGEKRAPPPASPATKATAKSSSGKKVATKKKAAAKKAAANKSAKRSATKPAKKKAA